MAELHSLAFDLGAGSGRAILGSLNNGRIQTSEIHRFTNENMVVHGHLRWNTDQMIRELKQGIRICNQQFHVLPQSLAIDTWGVDFALLDSTGGLLEQPFAYRDKLTESAMSEVFAKIAPQKLYDQTGIQFMPFNSLFQLWAIKQRFPTLMARADKLMMMPDYLTYRLTGEYFSEYTIASTSQMLNPATRDWHRILLMKLGLPFDILQEMVLPGTQVGTLTNSISSELGIPQIPVIAVGAHDTASAIAAIPATGKNLAYISSGTWSLMGIETPKPVINNKSFASSFTNEGGIDGKIRLLKNITGLWLLQESKKTWDLTFRYDYSELIRLAAREEAFFASIDPDDASFMNPENMVLAIQNFCRESGQRVPAEPALITRIILESLALKYRYTLDQLKELSEHPIETIHIIGGGSRNQLLCQFTANATGLQVVAGPAEGTAMGNLMVQFMSSGEVKNLDEIRCVIKNSVETLSYLPKESRRWNERYEAFKLMINNKRN